MRLDCKCIDIVTTGLHTKKWLRIHRGIRNLTCGALEIPLVMIHLWE